MEEVEEMTFKGGVTHMSTSSSPGPYTPVLCGGDISYPNEAAYNQGDSSWKYITCKKCLKQKPKRLKK